MKRGTQVKLAKLLNKSPQVINDYLAGRTNASPLIADQLSRLTNTDIRLWMQGGDVSKRRMYIEMWAASLEEE